MQLWACRFRAEQFYKPDFRGYSLRKGVVFEESLDIEDKSHRQGPGRSAQDWRRTRPASHLMPRAPLTSGPQVPGSSSSPCLVMGWDTCFSERFLLFQPESVLTHLSHWSLKKSASFVHVELFCYPTSIFKFWNLQKKFKNCKINTATFFKSIHFSSLSYLCSLFMCIHIHSCTHLYTHSFFLLINYVKVSLRHLNILPLNSSAWVSEE